MVNKLAGLPPGRVPYSKRLPLYKMYRLKFRNMNPYNYDMVIAGIGCDYIIR